jgi:hypothetical protein
MTHELRPRRVILTPRVIHTLTDAVRRDGTHTMIDDEPATELIAPTLLLRDPVDRLPTDRGRRFNLAAAIAMATAALIKVPDEWTRRFMADAAGRLEDVTSFGPTTRPAVRHDGDYLVAETLRATETFLRAKPATLVGPDEVLTLHSVLDLRFLVRDGVLHLHVASDAQDAVRTLPTLHEYVCRRLELAPGALALVPSTLYLRSSDQDVVSSLTRQRWPFKMKPMPALSDADLALYRDLVTLYLEASTFDSIVAASHWHDRPGLRYLLNWACVLRAFALRHTLPVAALAAHDLLDDPTLKNVLRQWLAEAGVIRGRVATAVDDGAPLEEMP